MTAKTSVSRVPVGRHLSRHIRRIAIFSSLLALLFLSAGFISFSSANRLMRQPAKPLDTFTSNILPGFNLTSFPSLDEQTMLSGWFFSVKANPKSTIILVHDQGKNRLQFDLDSAKFYQFLIDQGFNVLAFDLRNSGQSEGEMSGYGYSEWEDVLAAIRYVRKNSVTHNVLLYGFGTGVSASLLALDQLPPSGTYAGSNTGINSSAESGSSSLDLEDYPTDIQKLEFDQSYICGLLLDTPCQSPDNYIQAACRQDGFFGHYLLQYTVPYAIRLSAGNTHPANLITILTRSQLPVFLTYSSQDNYIGTAAILPLIDERQRLHPDTTIVFANQNAGYTTGFQKAQEDYLAALSGYFDRFFQH